MDWSITYILSQVFTVTNYILLAISYYAKDRQKILMLNFLSLTSVGIAYIFLNAWSGVAMCVIALIRNIIFLWDEKKKGKRENINKTDIVTLVTLYIVTITLAIFTYDGFLSLFSVFATMLYTYSVWQKKTQIYKLLGIPIGILWISYNTYIGSIFGMILETVLLVCSCTGYLLERKNRIK